MGREDSDLSAWISDDGMFRYSLTRELGYFEARDETVTFVMLNPSTADAETDDPTIRKCAKFARSWGFGRLKVVNIYAYRATDPRELGKVEDPVGPENFCTIAKVVGGSDLVVCAWGANAPKAAADVVLDMVAAPHALRLTKSGAPWHPLYVPDATRPVPFAHCPPEAAWP